MIKRLITWYFSPLLFGIAFVGPLIAQVLLRVTPDVAAALPVSNLVLGLSIGLVLGGIAQTRRSWIWVR
ncbi:MAG: hypothetical protein ACI9P7_001105 [Candidatus Azotimanducaceae bacterium]|jgi:hypothetical protein